nr:L-lactate permease [Ardenticatena sp.]
MMSSSGVGTTITAFDMVLAALPILAVLLLMTLARWNAVRAGLAGWVIAVVVGGWRFGATPLVVLVSQIRAFFLSAYVLYIIWAALLLYHVVNEAGGIHAISEHVSHLTSDQLMQFLLLAWAFASFLQGITGFGVPTAVVAPLLIGLGFDPMVAVVGTTLAHGWAVTFGSVASSFYAMLAVTDVNPHEFAAPAAFLLGVAAYGCGIVAAHVVRGWRGVARAFVPILLMGSAMAGVQYLLAGAGLWNIAAFGGGAVGVIVGALWAWWRAPTAETPRERPTMPLWLAVNAYIILLVLFLLVTFVHPLGNMLDRVQLTLPLPAVETTLGWQVDAGRARPISLFGHAGAIITYAALLAALVYARLGCYASGVARRIAQKVWRSGVRSTGGILAMVGMALVLDHTGMTYTLARGLAGLVGRGLPWVAPFIGALGAFMTGSNTNSNVVFGPLQEEMALVLGFVPAVILAAQTAGGALGSGLAPAKLIVGASTAGLAGQEGRLLRATLGYGIVLLVLVAVGAAFLAA